MTNGHHGTTQHSHSSFTHFGIPLLDEEFDPAEEEIVENNEFYSAHPKYAFEDEFAV